MIARILMSSSAAILLVFGALHLLYTFAGTRLHPRDAALVEAMDATALRLTPETTVWRAWVGFNASHSLALILFGLVFAYLAVRQAPVLFASPFLLAVGFGVIAALVVLARLYWFSIPLAGASLALALYVASIVASRL